MNAVIKLDVPDWEIGQPVTVYFKDAMHKKGICEQIVEYDPQRNDPVNHPTHYTTGKIECIDFITDKKLNFCRGNAVKYIVRAGLKDPSKEIEDLEKAVFYLNREIEDLKANY